MSKIEVVGLGALNMDYLYRVERILEDGETIVKDLTLSPGGSAANTIYGLARLGVKTGFTGAVGDDDDGKLLAKDFEAVGVDTSQIRVKPQAKTGAVLCLSDSLGRRSLYVSPGANNLLTMDDLDLTYLNQAGLFHLSSFADDRQFRMSLDIMQRLQPSTKVSFSPGALYASKGLKALTPILKKTYVLFISHDEMRQVTGRDVVAGAETCLEQGCQIVAVTLGKGMRLALVGEDYQPTVVGYIRDAKREYAVELHSQNRMAVVDTTGAGDAFTAGFLYGILTNKDLKTCGQLGNIVAQFKIARVGARAGLPIRSELAERYRDLYHQEL